MLGQRKRMSSLAVNTMAVNPQPFLGHQRPLYMKDDTAVTSSPHALNRPLEMSGSAC